ncbi:MAG: enoyl-CoA hydratase/isomerase family protein [Pyrinomonadaceae bacterium]
MYEISDAVIVDDIESVRVITFNRPEIRSPLSVEVVQRLHSIVDQTLAETEVDCIIFTGRDDVFASGADLREIAKLRAEDAAAFAIRGQGLMSKIESGTKLTIAAINGYCIGGALDLALACKKRIASQNSLFAHPGVSLGIITGWGGTQRLPRLIGEAVALEMFLTAKRVTADDAVRIGLIDEVCGRPLSRAVELAGLSVDLGRSDFYIRA